MKDSEQISKIKKEIRWFGWVHSTVSGRVFKRTGPASGSWLWPGNNHEVDWVLKSHIAYPGESFAQKKSPIFRKDPFKFN